MISSNVVNMTLIVNLLILNSWLGKAIVRLLNMPIMQYQDRYMVPSHWYVPIMCTCMINNCWLLICVYAAGYIEPPANVALHNVQNGTLTFTWSRVDPTNCAFEMYNITAEGCGICARDSNTSATCTDVQPSVNPTQCTFGVISVVCGLSGTQSNSTVVNIKGMSFLP